MKILVYLLAFLPSALSAYILPPTIDLRTAKAHIDRKFADAVVETFPFPHLIIEDVLPNDLYEQMLEYWPSTECFCNKKNLFRQLYVNKGCSQWMPLPDNASRIFWRVFSEVVATHYIKEAIKEKLMPYIHWKFPDMTNAEIEKLQRCMRFYDSRQDSLFQSQYGFKIPPHIDQIYLFATALLYCPVDNDHSHLGTEMYVCPEEKPPYQPDDYYRGDVITVKKAPYKRNTLFVMLQNPWQLHGSPLHDEKGYLRNMYGMYVYISPEQVEKLYEGSPYKFNLDWMYYSWEDRYLRYSP